MTPCGPTEDAVVDDRPGRDTWETALWQAGGDLLQSWDWGEFKGRHGWRVGRVVVRQGDAVALAQVLFRTVGPFTLAYLPRGPVVTPGSSSHTSQQWGGGDLLAERLLVAVDRICRRHRAISLVMEPTGPLPGAWSGSAFVPGPGAFQPARTVVVPLEPDEVLLAQMRRDTRQNIAHARRRGVTVSRHVGPVGPETMATFYALLRETACRGNFGIHSQGYYEDMLRVFRDRAVLLLCYDGGTVTGGLIAARSGDSARSMYGGSTGNRGRGDAALLRFTAMSWAREAGCRRYDLGGIAPVAPLRSRDGVTAAPAGGMDGVDQFKAGFGGTVAAFPAPVERRYRPVLVWCASRVFPRLRPESGKDQRHFAKPVVTSSLLSTLKAMLGPA